jgi:hypothetical protein
MQCMTSGSLPDGYARAIYAGNRVEVNSAHAFQVLRGVDVIGVGISSSVPFLLTSAVLFTETRVRLTFDPSSRRESNYCGEAASDPFGEVDLGPSFHWAKSHPLVPLCFFTFFLTRIKIPPGVSELTRRGCVTLAGMRFPALTPTAWPDNERFMVRKGNSRTDSLRQLLRKHHLHDGVYVRVAKRLGVDPSYVSKVASGKIISLEIHRALLKELKRIKRI